MPNISAGLSNRLKLLENTRPEKKTGKAAHPPPTSNLEPTLVALTFEAGNQKSPIKSINRMA
jgi:hypothetical protein